MVVIESIMARGFRRLRLEHPLTLEKGLTIIRGHNEAGKSTLIEAILFGLYGDANLLNSFRKPIAGVGRVTLADIVAHDANQAIIEVVFKVGGKRYKVYRVIERRGQSARQREARLIDLTTNHVIAIKPISVTQEVKKLIGVSWKEMLATNVVAQKDLEHLIQLKTPDREAIINMMMGLESFNKAKNRATEEKKRLNSELVNMKRELENKRELQRQLEDLKKQYDQYLEKKKEIEKQLPAVEKELQRVEKVTTYLKSLYEYLDKKGRLEESKKTLQTRIQEIQKEIARDQSRRRDFELKLETVNKQIKEKEEKLRVKQQDFRAKIKIINKLKPALNNLENIKSQYDELQNKLKNRQQDLSRLAEELGIEPGIPVGQWRTEVEKLFEIPRLTARKTVLPLLLILLSIPLFIVIGIPAIITLIIGVGILVYMYHKIQTERLKHTSALSKLTDAEKWNKEIEDYKKEIQQLTHEIQKALTSLPDDYKYKLKGEMDKTYQSLKTMIENIKQEANKLEQEINILNTKIEQLKERIKEYEDELRNLGEEVKKKQSDIDEIQKQLQEIGKQLRLLMPPEQSLEVPELRNPESLEEVKKVLEKYDDLFKDLREKKKVFETNLKNIKDFLERNRDKVEKLSEVKREIETLKKTISEISPRIATLEIIINSLSEISRNLRESFAPSVEQHMGRILNAITNGQYKAVKINPANYDIQIFDARVGRFLPRNIYSGGTNDQFLLAMRIAFTLALLQGAKGTYPKFLFLDEPLGSSDSERRKQILRLLSEELTKYFEQIILITHVEIPEVPNALLVTMEEGRIIGARRIAEIPETEI